MGRGFGGLMISTPMFARGASLAVNRRHDRRAVLAEESSAALLICCLRFATLIPP